MDDYIWLVEGDMLPEDSAVKEHECSRSALRTVDKIMDIVHNNESGIITIKFNNIETTIKTSAVRQ